jgi:hypothetical protein
MGHPLASHSQAWFVVAMGRKPRRLPKNEVGRAVGKLGGVIQAAATGRCAINTVHKAMDTGKFSSAEVCVRIARALHPTDAAARCRLIEALAGFQE